MKKLTQKEIKNIEYNFSFLKKYEMIRLNKNGEFLKYDDLLKSRLYIEMFKKILELKIEKDIKKIIIDFNEKEMKIDKVDIILGFYMIIQLFEEMFNIEKKFIIFLFRFLFRKEMIFKIISKIKEYEKNEKDKIKEPFDFFYFIEGLIKYEGFIYILWNMFYEIEIETEYTIGDFYNEKEMIEFFEKDFKNYNRFLKLNRVLNI